MLFFFFKQKTAYEMRISDWSSDVCSSDLDHRNEPQKKEVDRHIDAWPARRCANQKATTPARRHKTAASTRRETFGPTDETVGLTGPANRMIDPPQLEMDGGDMDEDEQRGRHAPRRRLEDDCPGIDRLMSPARTQLPVQCPAAYVTLPPIGQAPTRLQAPTGSTTIQ